MAPEFAVLEAAHNTTEQHRHQLRRIE